MRFLPVSLITTLALTAGCSDPADNSNANEVISRVTLTFTPMGGGTPVTAVANDPDGDGGEPPMIDAIALVAGTTYATTVRFENALEDPPEDITVEVADEADEHQVFFTGTAVNGPASNQPGAPLAHAYADQDANGLPIGLANTVTASAGSGDLTITLRHLPPVNTTATKTAQLVDQVKTGGFAGVAGESDAAVTFAVSVP